MLTINASSFIYDQPIIIHDPDNVIKLDPKINDKLTKEDGNVFYLLFAQNIPSNIDPNKTSLFGSFKVDNDFLKTSTTHEFKYDDDFKVTALYLPNMCLLKTCNFKHFQHIIAYQLTLNTSNITIHFDVDEVDNLICSNKSVNEWYRKHRAGVFHHQTVPKVDTNLLVYNECISIGNNTIHVVIKNNNDNKLNTYEDIFYKDYYQTSLYVKKLLLNLEKQKVTKFDPHINISQIVVSLVYFGPIDSHSDINIVKFFNIHHVGKFSKIYIHSNDLDTFQANPRPMQYVKVHSSATNIFKGITSLYNTCALYWGLEIDKGLSLHHIEVCSNMTINLIFTNINNQNTYSSIVDKLKTWIDSNYIDLLSKIKLWECIYNLKFDPNNYIPIFNGITASANINNVSVSDIDALNEILLQESCKLKFRTRTSIQMNGYGFYTLGSKYKMLYQNSVHEFLTTNLIYKDMLPTVHVGLNGPSDLTISVTDSFSYDELLFTFSYILSIFEKLNVHSDVVKSAELNIESIRKHSSKYGKNLLKILENMDPRLFGPRKIGKNVRSFSGLCQKPKQRAVPITKDEYDYIRTIVPDSVVNLQNQTYPNQRVYLFCPFKKYSFLNYHVFPNQLCIVRCTTKPSNKTQYNYCATSLGAEHQSVIQNKYENQTITLYNPLITKGRRCRLPEELKMILADYILLKLNIEGSVHKYCLNVYDKYPFIIRRNPNKQEYSILTEYNDELDYILILQSELSEEYFVFLNDDAEPLIFSNNEEIKKFFIANVRKTINQYNFFNFCEKLFKTPLSQYYNKMIKDILSLIKTEFDLKYIVLDKYIRGFLWKDKVCVTPKLYWTFDENDVTTIPFFKAIEGVLHGKYKFPNVDQLDEEHIAEIYKDYKDGKIHMVNFYNTSMPVEPFEISAKWAMKDILVFDSKAVTMNFYNQNIPKKYNIKDNQIKILNISDVVKNYVYIYAMNAISIDIEDLVEMMKRLYVVYDNETFIEYTDSKYKTFVSWRSSKINIEDIMKYFKEYSDLSANDIIKSAYKKFQEEMEFRVYKDEMIVPKIITV